MFWIVIKVLQWRWMFFSVSCNKLLIVTFYCNHSRIWNFTLKFRKKETLAAPFFYSLVGSFIIMNAINNFIWNFTHTTFTSRMAESFVFK